MSAQDMADAALAGLAQGEVVTIPLPELDDWNAYERSRKAPAPGPSRAAPAVR